MRPNRPWLLALTGSFICTAGLSAAVQEGPAAGEKGQPNAAPYSALPAGTKARIAQRAKSCYLLPDGRILDASLYYELASAVDSCFRPLEAGTKIDMGDKSTGILKEPHWLVDDSDESLAFGFIRERGWSATQRRCAAAVPPRGLGLYDMQDLGGTGRPQLLVAEAGAPEEFIFVDEARRDRVVRRMALPHYAPLRKALEGRFVQIELRALGQTLRLPEQGMFVRLPEGLPMPREFLPGRFLLVPNPSLEHPVEPKAAPRRRSSYDTVYEYQLLDKHPSAEGLFEAVRTGRLRAVTWSWERKGAGVVWRASPLL